MATTAEQVRTYAGPALFSYGFRPFFLLASAWSALAIPLWVLTHIQGPLSLPVETGLVWHVHEMVFGYGAGVVAGFLLTAIPNWTGRLPVSGAPLVALVALWCAGRMAFLVPIEAPYVAASVEAAFLVVFAGLVWREVIAGRNARNVKVALAVSVFAAANLGFHTVHTQSGGLPRQAIEAGLAVLVFLILLIGGRITPSFTRNWLVKRGAQSLPAAYGGFDAGVLLTSAMALALWAAPAPGVLSGSLLVLAGVLNVLRLARWSGHRTRAEPLVTILHIGYGWTACAMLLLGLHDLFPVTIPRLAGLHAAGGGAVGVMTLAVMTRASLGHTGHALTAGAGTLCVYLLINLAALVRVWATFLDHPVNLYGNTFSAVLWTSAFAVFCVTYGPRLVSRRKPEPA